MEWYEGKSMTTEFIIGWTTSITNFSPKQIWKTFTSVKTVTQSFSATGPGVVETTHPGIFLCSNSGETRICKLDQESQICNFTEVRENWWNYFLIGCNLTKTVALGETKITTELWRTQGKWSVALPWLKSTHSWKTWKKVLVFKDICLHSIKQNALDMCHHTFTNSLTVI